VNRRNLLCTYIVYRRVYCYTAGNRLGDTGLESLCQVVTSLPGLSTLNLACNEITNIGLKTLADCLQMPPSEGKETPFQVTYFIFENQRKFLCSNT